MLVVIVMIIKDPLAHWSEPGRKQYYVAEWVSYTDSARLHAGPYSTEAQAWAWAAEIKAAQPVPAE